MITLTKPEIHQLQLIDAETDAARIARAEWRRAQDDDLRALQDYVHQNHYIVWRPGVTARHRAEEVHITTTHTCTCSRFRLLERCQHVAFVRKLEAVDQLPGLNKPVAAREVK